GLNAQAQYTNWLTGDAANSDAQPSPGIVLMGGASEQDEAMKWFLERANGGDVVVIRTSGEDGYNDYLFEDLGVEVNSVETILFEGPGAATHPYVIEQLFNAEAIWIAGGDQSEYVEYWQGTAVQDAINALINDKGGPVGGTSAGMAILCGRYFSAMESSITSEEALSDPLSSSITLGTNDFLDVPFLQNATTDTHYDDPDRKGRHVVFMANVLVNQEITPLGIACDEFCAVTIDENGQARAWGESPEFDDNVYFLRLSCNSGAPEFFNAGMPITWKYENQALSVLHIEADEDGTQWLDLNDWQTHNGGTWEYWYTEKGELYEIEGAQPDCAVNIQKLDETVSNVYPNPFDQILVIETQVPTPFQMMDASGRVIHSGFLNAGRNVVNTDDLASGYYVLMA
ncbi:MAG: Type 1 glutamine amidotransferase-like domain-containing protein, partial [Bacteroidota bacterium]